MVGKFGDRDRRFGINYFDFQLIFYVGPNTPTYRNIVNGGASFRWSFGPLSAWGSKESTTILTTHPSLECLVTLHHGDPIHLQFGTSNTETLGLYHTHYIATLL